MLAVKWIRLNGIHVNFIAAEPISENVV